MKYRLSIVPLVFLSVLLNAQYAPPAGEPGSDAIHKDDLSITAWASGCEVKRGYQNIGHPELGLASTGEPAMATGKALSKGAVSLGDGGTATCSFSSGIRNGAGPDFLVFENGFDDLFLELAFVEVSSDGSNFFRFPAVSLTDTLHQTTTFGHTDAKKINNLAGKYRAGYGTPFDLEEMKDIAGLDINHITHVRIVDVVGSVKPEYASRDSKGNIVNDPWPTPFPQSGFDLDAVGVIHTDPSVGIREQDKSLMRGFPNTVQRGEVIRFSFDENFRVVLYHLNGNVLKPSGGLIDTAVLAPGLYLVEVSQGYDREIKKLIVY